MFRQEGKRRKLRETRGRFNIGTSIHQRPKEVKNHETFAHGSPAIYEVKLSSTGRGWGLDIVVLSRGKSEGCLATFVERQTRLK